LGLLAGSQWKILIAVTLER